ncbi:MAG: hypothetical protein JWO90_1587, partial [Solirubrobacterales bacterium]|nr:hypothetical protein [Solirubrobacterales bacterium]
MSPRGAAFELVRFTRTPVTEVVALVELEGRLARRTVRTSAPRLLVELEDGPRRELKPVAASTDDGILRASFTVPADDLDDATLALAFGGLLLDLPAPDPVPDADRIVGLTRELNALRRERAGLHEDVGAAKQRAA